MTARDPRPASARRIIGFVAAALVAALAPALSGAGRGADAAPSAPGPAPTTTSPIDPRTGITYATTSTNVLVTSPPPTVAPPTTVAAPAVGRSWPVEVPAGCDVPALPDVVFVGTVQATDDRTARFRIDQLRAGSADALSYQGLIDIRYDIDTKYLHDGSQYLVGASYDGEAGALVSRVTAAAPLFGGNDVIGQSELDTDCPTLPDPVRTLLTNGRPVDSGLLRPLEESKGQVLRAVLGPAAAAVGIVFGLAALRWLLTGLGWGVSSAVRSVREPPSMRTARRRIRDVDRGH